MSLHDEIKTLATAVLADIKTAITAADSVAANPVVAPFIPMIEQSVTNTLVTHGVPVADIEAIGQQIFAGVMALLTQAAAVSATTTVTSAGSAA